MSKADTRAARCIHREHKRQKQYAKVMPKAYWPGDWTRRRVWGSWLTTENLEPEKGDEQP